MPEPRHVTRIRLDGGPSHELLVLLDQHRVLTTQQLARATATPERTVLHRLDRLRQAHLVDCVRPGRETGSAPQHWWLRPAGAKLVTGTPVAAGQRAPSGLHVAHAATIGEVWLAVREHGPTAGVELTGWWADRAGWQEWTARGSYTQRQRRLTPDAVLHATVTAPDGTTGQAAAFVEVDLATMTQTLLREKVARYLTYAAERAWEGVHPHCPPLLLLTTTASRATTFVRAAGKQLAAARRNEYRHPPGAQADIAHAEVLVVAACGLVRDPATAVMQACWKLPDEAAAELSLAELLAERVSAQHRAEGWHVHLAAEADRREKALLLWVLRRDNVLEQHGQAAAEVYEHLVGGDGAGFLAAEPALAGAVLAWWQAHQSDPAGTDPEPVRAALRSRHTQVWAEHTRTLLGAQAHLDAADPHLAAHAVRLQQGQLLQGWALLVLAEPPRRTGEQVQREALGDYPARRDADADRQYAGLPWLVRRRTSRAALAAAYAAAHLLVCDTCATVAVRPDPDRPAHWIEEGGCCYYCGGTGVLLDYAHRDRVPTLAQRLAALRQRLDGSATPTPNP